MLKIEASVFVSIRTKVQDNTPGMSVMDTLLARTVISSLSDRAQSLHDTMFHTVESACVDTYSEYSVLNYMNSLTH